MKNLGSLDGMANWSLGLAGEVGEVIELIKKHLYHDKTLDIDAIEKELGDVLWYVAALCTEIGLGLDQVAGKNIQKLARRYPAGFSLRRVEEDNAPDVMIDRVSEDDLTLDMPKWLREVSDSPTPTSNLDVWKIPTEDD